MTNKIDKLDRIIGSIIGFAIGDAIAAPVEFAKKAEEVTGFIPAYKKGLKLGQYTDDTQHLLISLDSLTENHGEVNLEDIATRLKKWYSHGARSIGRTTELAIQNLKRGVPPEKSGIDNPNACGSLALPRLIPYCLFSALLPYEQKLTSGEEKRILGVTHAHKKVSNVGSLMHYYIQEMTHDRSAKATTLQIIDENDFLNRKTRKKLEEVLVLAESEEKPTDVIKKIGDSGYIEDVFYSALYCTLKSKNFKDSVLYAANGLGDADSRAAIAGTLSGLELGYSSIPQEWVLTLEDHKLLKKKAEELYMLSKRL